MKKKIILSVIVVVSIIAAALKFVNIGEILHLIQGLSLVTLMTILLITSLIVVLKTWRYHLLNDFRGIDLTYWQNLKIFIAGQTTSALPGGETLRAYLVEDETDTSFLVALGPIAVLGVFDVVTTAFLFLLGSIIFRQFLIPALFFAFGLGLFLLILLRKSVFRTILRPFHFSKKGKAIEAKASKVRSVIDIKRYFKTNNRSYQLISKQFLLAVITNGLGGLLFFVIAGAFSVHLNYFLCIFIYTASIILQVIGIVPAGIGVMDGGVTGILVLFGAPLSTAVAIVILYRLFTFIFSIILGSTFLFGFYHKVVLRKGKKK